MSVCTRIAWAAFLALPLHTTPAFAAPIQWGVSSGGNGHYYERIDVSGGLTWGDAKLAAESINLAGTLGHLVTVTSQAEADFLLTSVYPQVILEPGRFWLGAFQPLGSAEPDGGWQWVTGELWSFSNWKGGEPNNAGGNENVAHVILSGNAGNGTWNDLFGESTGANLGYILEFSVPEPSTALLLGFGLMCLGLRKKRVM